MDWVVQAVHCENGLQNKWISSLVLKSERLMKAEADEICQEDCTLHLNKMKCKDVIQGPGPRELRS